MDRLKTDCCFFLPVPDGRQNVRHPSPRRGNGTRGPIWAALALAVGFGVGVGVGVGVGLSCALTDVNLPGDMAKPFCGVRISYHTLMMRQFSMPEISSIMFLRWLSDNVA
jgi:hypothetical protein